MFSQFVIFLSFYYWVYKWYIEKKGKLLIVLKVMTKRSIFSKFGKFFLYIFILHYIAIFCSESGPYAMPNP